MRPSGLRLLPTNSVRFAGHELGSYIFFIGGEKSATSRCFTDPGMHRDCAEYSIEVCPYLARRDWAYSERPVSDKAHAKISSEVETKRPERV